MAKFEFFFDISSPWTYLAFSRVEEVADRCGVDIDFKPILVGGVFNAVNETVYEARANPHPVKGRYYVKDMRDWAKFCDVEIGQPPVFPLPAAGIMRVALLANGSWKMARTPWSFTMTCPSMRLLTVRYRCCCAAPLAAKPSPAMSSTCTAACWNVLPSSVMSVAAVA